MGGLNESSLPDPLPQYRSQTACHSQQDSTSLGNTVAVGAINLPFLQNCCAVCTKDRWVRATV